LATVCPVSTLARGLFRVASLAELYLLGRELFGWRAALFATMLAAGDVMHLHFSRIAGYVEPVACTVWSQYFLVRGLRRGPLWPFAAAGYAF